ncbi:cadherin-related family member 5-like [Halichoeres trimaculatus]|uniref:cadherin-related family member 5-like n=1 Tax=Halichoeres trimaculatus TaxID=147232 RepID=UPI003D9EBD1F
MEGIYPHSTVRMCLSLLFLILLQTSASVSQLCSGPTDETFEENNAVGLVIATLTIQDGVTLSFPRNPPPPDGFILEGNQLKANKIFDRENGDPEYTSLKIICTSSDGAETNFDIFIRCLNVNDNAPKFPSTTFNRNLPEMSPIGSKLGPFEATDLDGTRPSYTLTTTHPAFTLESSTSPNLIVQALLDYDKVKNIELVLQAVDSGLIPGDPVFTATATISINIVDVDNRPPWFEPCTKHEINGALVCQSQGYTGKVVLNEQEDGVLTLQPGPIHAYDGDLGIDEEIKYSFLGGDADGLFAISETTGGITMTRPADVLGTITLTVLAAQKINTFQFSTAAVSIAVQVKSLHPPEFQKTQYDAVITSVGSQAVDSTGEPLQILATDDDYSATGGFNPHITYSIPGSEAFSIINGYLFMTQELPEGALSLTVVATDTSNDESATAPLSVEVTSGTTTSPPLTTTGSETTGLTEEPTTGVTVPTSSPSMTTDDSVSTAIPTTDGGSTISTMPTSDPSVSSAIPTTDGDTTITTMPTSDPSVSSAVPTTDGDTTISTMPTSDPSVSTAIPTTDGDITLSTMPTSDPSMTTEGASTAQPPPVSSGYGPGDMAALGATLGVLLLICIIAITVLALKVQRGKSDWKKIYETSMFRSTLGQGSGDPKDGMQFVNDAFMNDEDGDDPGSAGLAGEKMKSPRDFMLEEAIQKANASLSLGQGDDASLADSDKTDDKDVKPILTKERRMGDDGYKSVWFKEDIDPNAKEEVVIIPDSREEEDSEGEEGEAEDDSEEEEEDQESSSKEKNNSGLFKAPKVAFNGTDLDSGLGVKMGDPAEDSDSSEMFSNDL